MQGERIMAKWILWCAPQWYPRILQVAYTANDEKTLKREISSLRNIRDSYPKYLLTLDYDTSNIDGIQRFNVIDWLLSAE